MRPVCRVLLALCVAGAAAVGPAAVAQAAGSGSITTGPSAEAWYRTAPVCALPTGCPAETPSPYPPDTLHIGVNLGQEEARTALQLDLAALPAGTKPAGGQLRLPIATGTQDGTRNFESADIRACAVTTLVEDADGSSEAPPEADCESGSAEAVFVPAEGEVPAAFTVDLTTIVPAWADSSAPGALTLVPAEGAAAPETWHVALSGREREVEGAAPITASITYVSAAVDAVADPPPFVPAPVQPAFDAPSTSFAPSDDGFLSAPSFEAPLEAGPLPAAPAETAPAPQSAPTAVVPVASFVDASFRYPAVFLLPLLFAGAVAWLGRALTRDLTAS